MCSSPSYTHSPLSNHPHLRSFPYSRAPSALVLFYASSDDIARNLNTPAELVYTSLEYGSTGSRTC
ncbi:unnamed protein product, partial [Nesidiocoris tenuis]